MSNADAVTRLEVIDHTDCTHCKGKRWIVEEGKRPVECPVCFGLGCLGRNVIFWDEAKQIKLSLQDQGQTLKIFISERGDSDN